MKQLLFILFVFIATQNTSHAQDQNPYDKTTWNVIRERLFNGENSKAFRFEEDIRFQVIGAKTHQDSAIIIDMIAELNTLLETVQVELVDANPNFKLTINLEEHGWSSNHKVRNAGSQITSVDLEIGLPEAITAEKSVTYIYFHTLRKLTKLYIPQHGSSNYGGIFDSPETSKAEFKEMDKQLLKKLYSHDFYKELKESTVKKIGSKNYYDFKYHELIRNFSYAGKGILILVVFLFFLSRESKRKQNPGLLLYLKQRITILLAVPFIFSIGHITGNSTPMFDTTLISVGIFIKTFVHCLLVIVIMYYYEPFFTKRINSFAGKQAFIFLSTIFAISIVRIFLLSSLIISMSSLSTLTKISFLTHILSWFFIIIIIATLRVFYNFITYKIQSMVNQKDVEIAKMKELKNQAELNALHSRINPHFLYNSLNSIASLAHIDANKTENMATGLSELFRYSINKENTTFVTVSEELEMVKKYLEIEKTRFGDNLVYEINIEDSTQEKQIPKFLIQPLVENAIKHGLSKIKGIGKVVVEVKKVKKEMCITIFDSGPDFPDEPVSGYGLQNINDKLDIIYGANAIINWENGENKFIKITLKNQF